MSVRQAQLEISSPEFTYWMAYYQEEPFGEIIADLRHGVATSVLANVNRNAEARPEPYRADDFIGWRETKSPEPDEPQFIEDSEAQSALIKAAIFGIKPQQQKG